MYYNEGLILTELERRYYLHLIGGSYEQLFYTFDNVVQTKYGVHFQGLSRIRLDVEVSTEERRRQSQDAYSNPDYKGMLDFMLKKRINTKLEQTDDLLATCPEIKDIEPLLKGVSSKTRFTDDVVAQVVSKTWLVDQMQAFLRDPNFAPLIDAPVDQEIEAQLKAIGFPLFMWLLTRLVADQIFSRLHPSLSDVAGRIRRSNRLTSGAIAALAIDENLPQDEKWMFYMLSAFNAMPMVIILNIISDELTSLLAQQHKAIASESADDPRLELLQHFDIAGDILRDLLSMEEFLKPAILDEIGFEHFDPSPYLFGYADGENQLSGIFFRARAYSLYRQLFKTGRIHPHETAVFLKHHQITRNLLHRLNDLDLDSFASHLKLHFALRQS